MFTRNNTLRAAKLAALALCLLGAGGCSTLKSFFDGFPGQGKTDAAAPAPVQGDPEELLEKARVLLAKGDTDQARKVLKPIPAAAKQPGITDQALFHLGILTLKEESESGTYTQSRQLFEQISREYPHSVWATEAGALAQFLTELSQAQLAFDKMKRQVKTLKDSNLSLTRENKEMRLNIEKLKSLDLELEQKSRR